MGGGSGGGGAMKLGGGLGLPLLLALLLPGEGRVRDEPFAQCWKPGGVWAPCGPGNDQCGPPYASSGCPGPAVCKLSFHIQDLSCGGGDTDFPFWDPVHGVYHLMYQDHVGADPWTAIGHVVSRDMTHWAHMPVALWPDRPWDRGAIFTGSATVVGGKPVLIYPGMNDANSSALYGDAPVLAQAVPADPSDPLYTNCAQAGPMVGFNRRMRADVCRVLLSRDEGQGAGRRHREQPHRRQHERRPQHRLAHRAWRVALPRQRRRQAVQGSSWPAQQQLTRSDLCGDEIRGGVAVCW